MSPSPPPKAVCALRFMPLDGAMTRPSLAAIARARATGSSASPPGAGWALGGGGGGAAPKLAACDGAPAPSEAASRAAIARACAAGSAIL